jgi:hypothetical protein
MRQGGLALRLALYQLHNNNRENADIFGPVIEVG